MCLPTWNVTLLYNVILLTLNRFLPIRGIYVLTLIMCLYAYFLFFFKSYFKNALFCRKLLVMLTEISWNSNKQLTIEIDNEFLKWLLSSER